MSIFIPLADAPFRKFLSGVKTVELRQMTSPVARQVLSSIDDGDDLLPGYPCTLSRGYSKRHRLAGSIVGVWQADKLSDLEGDVLDGAALVGDISRFFDPSAPMLAIGIDEPQGHPYWHQSQKWVTPLPVSGPGAA